MSRLKIFIALFIVVALLNSANAGWKERKALIRAAQRGSITQLKKYIRKGESVDTKDSYRRSLVMIAAQKGKNKAVEYLIRAGAYLNYTDKKGRSLLHFLVDTRRRSAVKAIKLALYKKADPTIQNNRGETPFHIAVQKNNKWIMPLLFKRKYNLNVKDNNGRTPLLYAVYKDKTNAAKLLVDARADVSVQDNKRQTVFHYVSTWRSTTMLTKLLSARGARSAINLTDNDGRTPLFLSASKDRIKNVRLFISKRADLDIADNSGKTAILIAAEKRNTSIVDLLLGKKADINKMDNEGQSLIHFAATLKYRKGAAVLSSVIRKGLSISIKDNKGSTPAGRAIKKGIINNLKILLNKGLEVNSLEQNTIPLVIYAHMNKERSIVSLLMKKGADINKPDGNGDTLLHHVARKNDRRLLDTLLKSKAQIDKQNNEGKTPLMVAIEKDNNRLANSLISSGANLMIKNRFGQTIMHSLASQKSTTLLKSILQTGAKFEIDLKDNAGKTPISIAVSKNRLSVVQYLVELGANINGKNEKGNSLLISASENDYNGIIFFLILKGAKINVKNSQGESLLLLSLKKENRKLLKTLIERKVNINEVQVNRKTPLVYMLEKEKSKKRDEIAKILLDSNARFKIKSREGNTPLAISVTRSFWKIVNYLLAKGANPNGTDYQGKKLLNIAYDKGSPYIFEKLLAYKANPDIYHEDLPLLIKTTKERKYKFLTAMLKYKANINIRDQLKNTAIIEATKKSSMPYISLLVKNGANLNLKNNRGQSPLHIALKNRKVDIIGYLLNNKADPNVKNKSGETPAVKVSATSSGKKNLIFALAVIKLLGEKGANFNIKNKYGNSALDKATVRFNIKLAEALLKYGANVNQQDKRGNTVLKKTVLSYIFNERRKADIARRMIYLYLQNGAYVNVADKKGRTPLIDAVKNANDINKDKVVKVARMLIDNGASIDMEDSSGESAKDYSENSKYSEIKKVIASQKQRTYYSRLKWETKMLGTSNEDIPLSMHDGPGGYHYLLAKTGMKYQVIKFSSNGRIVQKKEVKEAGGMAVNNKGDVYVGGIEVSEFYGKKMDRTCKNGENRFQYVLKMNSNLQDLWKTSLGKTWSCVKMEAGPLVSLEAKDGVYVLMTYDTKKYRVRYVTEEGKEKGGSIWFKVKPNFVRPISKDNILVHEKKLTILKPNCYWTGRLRKVALKNGTRDITEFDGKFPYVFGQNNDRPERGIFIDKFEDKTWRRKRLWSRQLASGSLDYAKRILIDGSENIYLVGETTGNFHGNKNYGKKGTKDIFIIKLDKEGKRIWTRQYGSTKNDVVKFARLTGKGNLLITGTAMGNFDRFSNKGNSDIFIMKIDSMGNLFK
ncbi:ankyrin repeat domain-containing protein [Spirochaetota bacterium]